MSDKLLPEPPAEAQPVLQAAAEGRLLVQRCSACGHVQFPPRVHCTSCGEARVEHVEASGRGTVRTFAVIHRNRAPGWVDEVPYVVAVVDLEEGCRITSNVVGCAPGDVRVGMAVDVTFEEIGDLTLPRFRPIG